MTSDDGDGRTWWNRHRPRLATATIAGVEFPRVSLPGGLDPGAVHTHLAGWQDAVENELSVSDRERDHWHQKYRRLEMQYLGQGDSGAAVIALASAGEASNTAARMIAKAQDTIDEQFRRARAWCERLTDDARERRDGIIADGEEEARQRHDQIVAEATAEASRIIGRAREGGAEAAAASLRGRQPAPGVQVPAAILADLARYQAQSEVMETELLWFVEKTHLLLEETRARRQAATAAISPALQLPAPGQEDSSDHDQQQPA